MTNTNGLQLPRLIGEGANKMRFMRNLYLFSTFFTTRQEMAEWLGVTSRTLRNTFAGHKTEVDYAMLKKRMESFMEEYREDVDKYQWEAWLTVARIIAPNGQFLEVKVEKLAAQVRKHMEDFPTNWPSAWLRHFAKHGVSKRVLRVTIRRIIAKNPKMAEFDIDYKDDYPAVMPDPIDKVIKWVGATEEAAPKVKKSGGSAKPRKTSAPRPATSKAKKAPQEIPVEPGEFVPSDDPEVRRRVDARLAKLLKSADQLPD